MIGLSSFNYYKKIQIIFIICHHKNVSLSFNKKSHQLEIVSYEISKHIYQPSKQPGYLLLASFQPFKASNEQPHILAETLNERQNQLLQGTSNFAKYGKNVVEKEYKLITKDTINLQHSPYQLSNYTSNNDMKRWNKKRKLYKYTLQPSK